MSENIETKIKEDLLKHGYATEMVVASLLQQSGWQAIDHSYYLDRDENKGREIDAISVRRATAFSEKKKVTVTLALATEVKRSLDKPWVVFTQKKPDGVSASWFNTVLVRLNLQEIWFDELYRNHALASNSQLGKVACQCFTGSNATFGGLASCFKAADEIVGYLRAGDRNPLRDPDTKQKTYEIGIAHGLFVVDGGLWQAEVNGMSAAELEVQPAVHIPYIFNHASKEYGSRSMLIDFVTLSHLPNYLKSYGEWLEERATFCLSELA